MGIFDIYPHSSLFLTAEKTGVKNVQGYNNHYVRYSTRIPGLRQYVWDRQIYCVATMAGTVEKFRLLLARMATAFFIYGVPFNQSRVDAKKGETYNPFCESRQ